ncbi:glutamate-gated chloride channel-like, partial [Stegodyphus dumicola]|uniref:glutamate-gated chloride channel-like n=1 Tax=Stegodyphus dumicola TaxID=202533 RepID=UPI0015A7C68C
MALRTPLSSLVFILLFCHISARSDHLLMREKKAIFDQIYRNYDGRLRPVGTNGTGPTVVTCNMYVRGINDFDDSKMEYETQLTFRQSWVDDRLRYLSRNVSYMTLDSPGRLWQPDGFFPNENSGKFHNIIMPNTFTRIYPNGTVLYSIRISLKLFSPCNLENFPFDNQVRTIIFASYGYTTDDLVFLWKRDDPVQVTKNLHMSKFTLNSFFTDHCKSRTNTGEYSCLKFDMLFSRNFNYYLVRLYLPTAALVLLSFVTFWLRSHMTTARFGIWMGSLICFFVVNTSANDLIPEISYTTALDVWMGVCVCLIFGVLLEHCLVVNMNEKSDQQGLNVSGEQITEE